MTLFYKEELQHIIDGDTASPVLSNRVRRKLRQYGIIELLRSKVGRGYASLTVTPRALLVLEDGQTMTPIVPARATEHAQSGRIDPHGEGRVIDSMEVRTSE